MARAASASPALRHATGMRAARRPPLPPSQAMHRGPGLVVPAPVRSPLQHTRAACTGPGPAGESARHVLRDVRAVPAKPHPSQPSKPIRTDRMRGGGPGGPAVDARGQLGKKGGECAGTVGGRERGVAGRGWKLGKRGRWDVGREAGGERALEETRMDVPVGHGECTCRGTGGCRRGRSVSPAALGLARTPEER